MAVRSASIVIPARNAAATLGEQLEGLSRSTGIERCEVIVVDNGSTDDTRAVIERARSHLGELKVVECSEPGSNRARNTGIRAAAGRHILLCDADDVVAPGWIDAMDRALARDDIVGGRLETASLNHGFVERTRDNPTATALPTMMWHLPYAISANMGLRREVFEALGGFDEGFSVGGDEVDFCWRAQYAGYSVGYAADAVVAYRYKDSLRGLMRQMRSYGIGSAQLCRKHIDLGALPEQNWRRNTIYLGRYARSVAPIYKLTRDRAERWRYLAEVAWLVGVLRGFARFKALPT